MEEKNKGKLDKAGEQNVTGMLLQSKQRKLYSRKRMHGIWKQEGMKEVKEQKLCDQRRQIEEKHWLEELEMETIKQKTEGQSTKVTEVAPVVKIVTEEMYIELFGIESD